LWHDPGLNKDGCTKSKNEAIKGYQRLIDLTSDSFSSKNWYKIKNISQFSSIKVNGNVKVREAAQLRINTLNAS